MKLKIFLRNNLLLLPQLLKGNGETRIYVLKSWINNNLTLLFYPLIKRFQRVILLSRLKNLKSLSDKITNHNMDSVLEKLDIFYINLEHRQDRDKEIIEEFNSLGHNNYTRFNAIRNTNGALGCALSHKTILGNWEANDSSLLMVCEDDLKFIGNLEELEDLMSKFINDKHLDILCLSHNHFNEVSYNKFFNLTSDTQTTSCYIVKPHMKEVLLDNFNLSVKLLEVGIDHQYSVAIDQVWKVLQKKYNFVIPKKRFAHQRESFSDIENRVVDYKV